MQEYIIINEKDNVAVALADLKAGTVIKAKDKEVIVKEDIMRGHIFCFFFAIYFLVFLVH